MEVLRDDFLDAYLDPGPPYVPGTCYPLRRYMLLHDAEVAAIRSLPNPFASQPHDESSPNKEKDGSPE